jgi:hypothetical protein
MAKRPSRCRLTGAATTPACRDGRRWSTGRPHGLKPVQGAAKDLPRSSRTACFLENLDRRRGAGIRSYPSSARPLREEEALDATGVPHSLLRAVDLSELEEQWPQTLLARSDAPSLPLDLAGGERAIAQPVGLMASMWQPNTQEATTPTG